MTNIKPNRAQRRAAQHQKPRIDRNWRTLAQATVWAQIIDQVRPYDPGEMVENFVQIRCAFERLRTGAGDLVDADLLSTHINLGIIRAEQIDPELVELIGLGQQAMVRMAARHQRGLPLGFDGQGLQDVPTAIEAFEVIAQVSSPMQMQQAITEMYRRIRGGHVLRADAP